MRSLIGCTLGFFVCATLIGSVSAQKEIRPLSVEDALGQKSFPPYGPISLSPDGKWIAYTLRDSRKRETALGTKYKYFTPTGVGRPSEGCTVWLTNTKNGETLPLAPTQGTSSWGPAWSPDGNYLAFYSASGGGAPLWSGEKAPAKTRQA